MDNMVLKETLVQWRHYLHQHPETAFEERQTAAFVAEKLREMGLVVHEGIGGTGVIGDLKVGDGTAVIGLRADLDGINLRELNQLPYQSLHPGKFHGCGHDGHIVTLLGAARLLSENRNFNGTVRFLFQPAEEPGRGAQAMIEDGILSRFPMDEIYGIHNDPTLPEGTFYTRIGSFCSSEDNFTIKIHGKGGHASAPQNVCDPLMPAAQIYLSLQSIVSRNAPPTEFAVVSCTQVHTDGAHNAIPGTVVITGDTRSYTRDMQTLIESRMGAICEHICRAHNTTCEFEYTHEFAPTVNSPVCTGYAIEAAIKVLGENSVFGDSLPFTVSEDFGVFLEKIPGCFAFLGTGRAGEENSPLHSGCFDYNDNMLLVGAEYFARLICDRLKQ